MDIAGHAIAWVERGIVPDALARAGIRRLLRARLAEVGGDDAGGTAERLERFLAAMREAPIALVPQRANEQHYELPPAFFERVLGARMKYSACWWPPGVEDLDAAEDAALAATAERARLANGQRVLELGCGWGALALWIAERYPASHVTAVSNSAAQRGFIEAAARSRGLGNLAVVTADINDFDPGERFDRILSVEMFEHLRNWPLAFARVRSWLAPQGLFFLHVFVHRGAPYAFVERDAGDWMSRYFFAGGMMPSAEIAPRLQDDLKVLRRWRWSGLHYERTANAWLARLDRHADVVRPVFERCYGAGEGARWIVRWRLFFMACAELFGYDKGQRWWIAHDLLAPR